MHEYCSWTRDLSSVLYRIHDSYVLSSTRGVCAGCQPSAEIKPRKKSKERTGGPRVRVPLSLSGWLARPQGLRTWAVQRPLSTRHLGPPPHLAGLLLFSFSSSAIESTGAPEPACDSIEMPDGACNLALTRDSPEIALSGTDVDPAGFHSPLDRRRSVCSLAFAGAEEWMPPSTGASAPGRFPACLSLSALVLVLCTYDPISPLLLRFRAPHCARRPLDLRGVTDCCRPTLRSEIER